MPSLELHEALAEIIISLSDLSVIAIYGSLIKRVVVQALKKQILIEHQNMDLTHQKLETVLVYIDTENYVFWHVVNSFKWQNERVNPIC